MGELKGADPYRTTLDEEDKKPLETPLGVLHGLRWPRLALVVLPAILVAFGIGYNRGAKHAYSMGCHEEVISNSPTFNQECTYPGAKITPLGGTYSVLCICPEKKP